MLFTHEEGKSQRLSVYFPQGTSSSTNFRFSSPHKGSVSRLICWCFSAYLASQGRLGGGWGQKGGRWGGRCTEKGERDVSPSCGSLDQLGPASNCSCYDTETTGPTRGSLWPGTLSTPAVGGVRQLSLFKPVQLIQPSLESLLTPGAGGWGRRCKGQLLTCTTGLKFSGLEMLNTHQQILSIDLTGTLDSTNSF